METIEYFFLGIKAKCREDSDFVFKFIIMAALTVLVPVESYLFYFHVIKVASVVVKLIVDISLGTLSSILTLIGLAGLMALMIKIIEGCQGLVKEGKTEKYRCIEILKQKTEEPE